MNTKFCEKHSLHYDALYEECPLCYAATDPSPLPVIPVIDTVNHPSHYTAHPSGVECIDVTEHMNFNVGNAVKYLWRADLKNDPIENLRKAIWYIEREIQRRTAATKEMK